MESTGLSTLLRGALGIAGTLAFLLGLLVIAAGGAGAGVWLLVVGVVLILVALYEQTRYRSIAEPSAAGGPSSPAPATPLPGRYQRTDEVFDDPTTGERMRVWFDPTTGERRYVAER